MRKKKEQQQTYQHPTYGELPLVPHPDRPWRLVAYYGGREIYETDALPTSEQPEQSDEGKGQDVRSDTEPDTEAGTW